jgi:quercetin dioxygenase-like cupin family protein
MTVGHFLIPNVTAQTRKATTTNLITTDLGNWCDGKEVNVEVNEFSPGTSGRHYHPAHSFTWILEGSEAYTLEGQPTRTVSTGELLHEAPMQVHSLDNQSPVKLLVLRIAEKGKPATVRGP